MAEWSIDRIFQAQLINELKLSNYYYLCAHKGEDQQDIPKPKMIQLPGHKELTPQERAQAEVDAFSASVAEIPAADLSREGSFFADMGVTSAVPPIPIPGR